MCGIVGLVDVRQKFAPEERERIVTRMAERLTHRGPDDFGIWQNAEHGVAFAFRRLAIRDVSPAGHQPMLSATGRYCLIFNGEVYNSDALRTQLAHEGKAPQWRGTSDTETMLAAIEAWGLREAVTRFIGMFAFALWDRQKRSLSLVRDRIGIKPLHYGQFGETFVFASEPKAFFAFPDFSPVVNKVALTEFLRRAYVPCPLTIYENVRQFPPGSISDLLSDNTIYQQRYWSVAAVYEQGQTNPFCGTDSEAIEVFNQKVSDAVGLRMIADVPLGAFLSGGLDSSFVVALMQAQSSRPVQTFCIGFTEEKWNEAPFARTVAKHLGTDHHELILTPEEAMSVIPRLPEIYDVPFADASQIPMLLVSELARQQVTVALSGDGGDELLAGYYAYTHGDQIRKLRRRLGLLTSPVSRLIEAFPPTFWQFLLRKPYSGDRLHKLAEILRVPPDQIHTHLMSHWKRPGELTGLFTTTSDVPLVTRRGKQSLDSGEEAMWYSMFEDMQTYLPDDILVKVDRASMAVSLEARVPLLDHRFVEFCASLPMSCKRRDGQTKWILRQALDRYIPRSLFDRPKRGFGVPIDDWLRGPLKPWAESLLTVSKLQQSGLNPEPVHRVWHEHQSGLRNFPGPLWNVLMYQSWAEHKKPVTK